MTERRRLPDRRQAETLELEVGGLRYTCTLGRFPDGQVGELFLSNNKSNSSADVSARDAAVVASIALQYSVPIDVLRHALTRDARGKASGPLGAALDLLAAEHVITDDRDSGAGR
jgi:hypothetical protein